MANIVHNLIIDGGPSYPLGTVHYIEGTGTTAGKWLGTDNSISEYYDGLTIAYRIPIAGASTTTLDINGIGARTVRRNTSNLTTQLPANTVVILTYTTISGTGYWVWADYDSSRTLATAAPLMDGTAAVGTSSYVARQDHVHPTDTSRAPTSHASSATTYGVSSASNYGHAMASSTTPKANGTAAVGSETAKFARGDHVHPLQTTVSGNAGTATKLATARTISLGTGATGTATSFDGSSNITIPVTSVKEAYISWGGKDIVGSFSPLDAAMVSELGANRFSFIRSSSIEIEYSNDNGTTWTDYGLSDSSKVALFSGISIPVAIGNSTKEAPATADSKLRITLTQQGSGLYNSFNKFVMLVSTNGSSGSTVTIQQALNSDLESWTDVKTASLSGWSGYNVINLSPSLTFGGGSTQVGKLRFVFSIDGQSSSYSGLQIHSIGGYGGVGWTCPSTMAKTGHLYSYDSSQNVTFPSSLTATIFNGTLNGTSNRAVADSDGSNIISTYAKKTEVSTTYATKTEVKNLTTDDISAGTEDVWIFDGGTSTINI